MGSGKISLIDYKEPTALKVVLKDEKGIDTKGHLDIVISTFPLVKFKVKLLELRNLESKTEVSWPDPYVVIKQGKNPLFKSKPKTNSRSCLINEEFFIEKFTQRLPLVFDVFDDNIFQDKLLGTVEVPLNYLYLTDSIPTEKSYFISFDLFQTLTFSITPIEFSQNTEEYRKKEEKFELDFKTTVKEKYRKEMDLRRKHSKVSKYYLELLSALDIFNIEQKINKLSDLFEEINQKEKSKIKKRNRNNFEESVIQLVSDIVFLLSKGFIQTKQDEKAHQLLIKAEIDFTSQQITHLLDRLILKERKDFYFKNFFKYHTPEKYNGNKYLSSIYLPIVGMYFSWVVYQHSPRWMFERVFDETVDKRLEGLGKWIVKNEIHTEAYFINFHCLFAVCEEYGTVVCAVRGTEFDINDRKLETIIGWVANFEIEMENLPQVKGAKIHKGFLQQYLSSKVEIMIQIEEYLKKDYQVLLTGHSQGAGISGIIALDCSLKFPNYMKQIHHHTFGQPRLGNEIFAKYMNENFKDAKRFFTQYNQDSDMVSTVPPENFNYHHYGTDHKIVSNPKYYGNPNKIPGIEYEYDVVKDLHKFMSHGQQVYLDGLIDEIKLTK